ncbi:hypothetical protein RND81_14G132700 [Saponaria officinalis]|uniref:Cellulose synthase-like protein G2 n=1 Tax=Saponaria officinalis TaxID=3572 RepID=A0AAW1GRU4_SAPOF
MQYPLNSCTSHKVIINRLYTLLHFLNLSSIIYYGISNFNYYTRHNVLLPYILVSISELFLSLYSLLSLAYGWHRVTRTPYPDRLPEDEKLPAIDVPPIQVMNTVISAMALDYPPDKMTIYISDDGGELVTLLASKEKYRVFQDGLLQAQETARLEFNGRKTTQDHSAFIEVIGNGATNNMIPSLIYVAREKRPHHPHHYKTGAINALVRVSGLISNAPYILKMDCDMCSNDPSSARQAMCFHLDPKLSKSLAYVQFPQRFYNVNKANDIYDGQIRHIFEVWTNTAIPCGTGIYLKREALHGEIHPKELEIAQLKETYGVSNACITSLERKNFGGNVRQGDLSSTQLSEAQLVASSTYEQNTQWGKEVGYMYDSALEDYFTGFNLHCRGWKSVYCNPERPAFLGCATINLNDALIQFTRWETGFLDVTLSKYCPLYYGPFVKKLSLLQSMCYAHFGIEPLTSFPFWCLSTLPQLCLLLSIPLYPKVTSPWFAVFSIAFLSCLSKHLADVLTTGGSITTWWNEERIHVMKGVTSFLYGNIDAFMKKLGLKQAKKVKPYNQGKFDFRVSNKFIIPLAGLVIFNLGSFAVGVWRVFTQDQWNEFLGLIGLSFFVTLLGYPVIEGMVVRTDNAAISASVSLKSSLFALGIFIIGSVFLHV